MRMKEGFRLRFLVALVVSIATALTLTVSIAIGYHSEKTHLSSATLELNRMNAEKLALTTDQLLQSIRSTVSVTAGLYKMHATLAEQHATLELIRKSNSNLNSLIIVDKNGIVRDTVPSNVGAVGKQLTSEAAKQALQLQQPLISEPYTAITNRLIILISYPIFDEQKHYLGFAAGTVYLHESNVFEALLGSFPTSDSGSFQYVVSSKGMILYHPDKSRIGENASANPVVKQLIQGRYGVASVHNLDDDSMLAGYYPVSETHWGIVTQTPLKSITDASTDFIVRVALAAIPLIALILALSYLLIHFISKPLYSLAEYAGSWSVGENRTPQIPSIHRWNYEANQLYRTIAKAAKRIQSRVDTLSTEAKTDALTGLNNRRALELFMSTWREDGIPFTYLLADIDHFKTVNDTFGHQMGDEVLRFLARTLEELVQQDDIVCRYGGEEFVILSPHSTLTASSATAERIRAHVAKTISPTGEPITLSIGVSAADSLACSLDDVLEAADRALYQAKSAGRNRVAAIRSIGEQQG